MTSRSAGTEAQAYRIWQARQRADGRLVGALAVAASLTTFVFLFSPGPGTAWVMGLFLVALALACVRLADAASAVASLRKAPSQAIYWSETVDAEILDVYEHPGLPDKPVTYYTDALWLAARDCQAPLSPGWNPSRPRRLP